MDMETGGWPPDDVPTISACIDPRGDSSGGVPHPARVPEEKMETAAARVVGACWRELRLIGFVPDVATVPRIDV